MGLRDAAVERVQERFDASVEAVRIGTVIAQDAKALNHWRTRSHRAAQRSRGLVGQDLEAAIAGLASMFPGHVERGVMAA